MSYESNEFNFQNKKNEFYNNLTNNYPVIDNNPTHTSIGDPFGKWSVPDENYDYFLNLYSEIVLKYKINVHLTEKHKKYSPILIDLDFRYNLENPDRLFDLDFIKKIIQLYNLIIKDSYKNIPEKYLESYILLKDTPIFDTNKYKDAVSYTHLTLPTICSV